MNISTFYNCDLSKEDLKYIEIEVLEQCQN